MLMLRHLMLGLAVAAIVWPSTKPDAVESLAGSQWYVVEVDGSAVNYSGSIRFTRKSVRGTAACNRYFGSFRENAKGIVIAGINTTRKLCHGMMKEEQRFIAALNSASTYHIKNKRLVLVDSAGKPVATFSG